jgi:anti-sigma B factor antagonist
MSRIAPTSGFEIETRRLGAGVIQVQLFGEVGLAIAPQLQAQLDDLVRDRHPRLVVDLTEATFLDSTGLEVLLGAARQLPSGRFAVACPDRRMRDLFQLVGHNLLFRVDETLDQAVGHLRASGGLSADLGRR